MPTPLDLKALLAAIDVINEAPPAERGALVVEVAEQMAIYAEQIRSIPSRVTTRKVVA